MQVNDFLKEVFEDRMGLDYLGLDYRFAELVQLIERKTLLAFSNCIGVKYLTYLDLSDRSKVVRKEYHSRGVEFQIDDPILDKFNLPILGIETVRYNNVSGVDPYDPDSTEYYNALITSRQNMTLEGMLMGSEYTYNRTQTDNATPFKPYKEFRGGRILYLRNWGYHGLVEITVKTTWPNLVSIPEEYHEEFIQLAIYDIQIKLWNEMKYIEDVPTANGNLQLRVDWSGAENERRDFLRDLKQKSLPDRVGPRYFQLL